MKKILALLGLALTVVQPAFAFEPTSTITVDAQTTSLMTRLTPFNIINWKEGDTASFDLSASVGGHRLGKAGTMTTSVTKDEGASLWVSSEMNILSQTQKTEMQLNKVDGRILKLIVNGIEQAPSDEDLEIISQNSASVTVPAGTFRCVHIVAKTSKANLEIWANSAETVMEGTIKQITSLRGIELVVELTRFRRAP